MIICSDVLLGCYKTLFQAQFGPLRQSKITNFKYITVFDYFLVCFHSQTR